MKRELMRTAASEQARLNVARFSSSRRERVEPLRPPPQPDYPTCSTCGAPLPGDGKCSNAGPQWPHRP